VAVTLTPALGLPQWGQGADNPSRQAFDDAFARVDAGVAIDDGASVAALPTTGVNGQPLSDRRYAHVVNGNYRQLYRRAGGAWAQVGGNMWPETVYHRGAGNLATTAAARILSHPGLTNPSATENWDGSTLRGGLQAVGDVNSATPGAVHSGDITSPVDLTVRGRVFARTTADNQRGFVASAHAATAGNLFSAIDATGSLPWTVDAQGRMRSQAPSAFGASGLTANVPLASTPGANDLTALDLYALTGATPKPALRLFRAAGDQIGSVLPDSITLGKAGWTGAAVNVLAPTVAITGALGLTGALTVSQTLAVTGAATLAGLTAAATTLASLTVNGSSTLAAVQAASATVTGAASVGSTLGVTGAVTLASTLAVTGASTLAGLTVNGSAALKSGVTVTGAASVSSDLSVGGLLKLPTSQPGGASSGQVRVASDMTLEVYDGTAWRGNFGSDAAANSIGRKHYWDQQSAPLFGTDAYTQVTGLSDALSPQGSIATLSNGDLLLNAPGLWSLNCSFFCDSTKDGLNRVQFRWVNGGFPGRARMTDVRTRQVTTGASQSGNGEATITWVGWVSAAAAAQAIQVWVAQRTSDGTAGTCTYTLSAEYLGR
jgi:hypothetical protein